MSDPQDRPPDAVPGDDAQPSNRPIDEEAISTDLDAGEGGPGRIAQEPVGPRNERGGGEFPPTDASARGPSPGAAGITPERGPGKPVASNETSGDLADDIDPPEHFKDVLNVDPDRFGSSTTPDDRTA